MCNSVLIIFCTCNTGETVVRWGLLFVICFGVHRAVCNHVRVFWLSNFSHLARSHPVKVEVGGMALWRICKLHFFKTIWKPLFFQAMAILLTLLVSCGGSCIRRIYPVIPWAIYLTQSLALEIPTTLTSATLARLLIKGYKLLVETGTGYTRELLTLWNTYMFAYIASLTG